MAVFDSVGSEEICWEVSKDNFLIRHCIKFLTKKEVLKENENAVKRFKEALGKVNNLFDTFPKLQESKNRGLLAALIYYQLAHPNQINAFVRWVLANHLHLITNSSTPDLIAIFDKVLDSRKRTIFVSMQFSETTKPNYDAIKAAVKDLNTEHKLDLEIRPIRVDEFQTGYSYKIDEAILSLIEASGLLIADLTGGNKNVYHEIGYLMGLNQGHGLRQENFILLHNGSIGDTTKDIGFNLAGISQLRVQDTNKLREEIKKQVAIFYGLT